MIELTTRPRALLLAALCMVTAGCDSHRPLAASHPPLAASQQDHSWIKITPTAAAELKKRAKDRPLAWIVMYNGTCNGAPALGFYPADADSPDDAEAFDVSGIELLVKHKVVGLHERWGDLVVDCQPQNDNLITVEFTRAARATCP